MAAPVLARTLKFKVSVTEGGNAGQSYVFDKPVVTIGRGPENDIVFANDPKMSRAHAELRVQAGQLLIRNLSQKNFILINGEKAEEKTISTATSVQIGETVLRIQLDEPAASPVLVPNSAPAGSAVVLKSMPATVPPPQKTAPVKKQVPAQAPMNQAMGSPVNQGFPSPQYSAPNPGADYRAPAPSSVGNSNAKIRLYLIVAAVGIALFWLLSDDGKGTKKEAALRTEGDVVRAIEESAKAVQEIKKQQAASGQDSIQYKSAQEHYIKGFRDYSQGQYARAMQSMQAALSFYPSHELARKYLVQAQRKFEAQVDFHMSQGRKYYQKQNFKMCKSSFASVMIMLKDSSKPKYREAKQFYDECSLRVEGGL